jgi:hypothetical protein
MRVFGSSLAVARIWTELLAVGVSWLMFAGGRAMGMRPAAALAGSALATVLPCAAVLGSATVPELPTAALCAFALMAIGPAPHGRWPSAHISAALSMLAATLSRYEAWPVTLVVAGALLVRRRFGLALVALSGPLFWLLHNRLAHGDAIHFLRRVSAYRSAMGGASAGWHDAKLYALSLATDAPVLTLSLVVAVAALRIRRSPSVPVPEAAAPREEKAFRSTPARWHPAWIGSIALIVFLMTGAFLGGAPTHHLGRALLVVWLLAAMALAEKVTVLTDRWHWAWLGSVALTSMLWLPHELAGGVDRRAEVAAGQVLRAGVATGQRVLVAADDYGYFAVMAAFGRPLDVVVDRTHDPRKGAEGSALAAPALLQQKLQEEHAHWLVAPARFDAAGLEPAGLSRFAQTASLAVWRRAPGMPSVE